MNSNEMGFCSTSRTGKSIRFRNRHIEVRISRPSQAFRRSEKVPLILAERPANGGLLRISHRSPGSDFGHSQSEIADSFWSHVGIFPFSGDGGWRLAWICTAWPVRQCYLLWSPTIWARKWELSIVLCVTGVGVCLAVEGPLTAQGPSPGRPDPPRSAGQNLSPPTKLFKRTLDQFVT
jgi:hypothetical protein